MHCKQSNNVLYTDMVPKKIAKWFWNKPKERRVPVE